MKLTLLYLGSIADLLIQMNTTNYYIAFLNDKFNNHQSIRMNKAVELRCQHKRGFLRVLGFTQPIQNWTC